jgi:ribosomal protein S14
VGGQRYVPAALPLEKTRYPLYTRLGGPQSQTRRVRKISPPPGFNPRTVKPVASRYTDWATQPTINLLVHLIYNKTITRFNDLFYISVSIKLTLASEHSIEACHYTYMITNDKSVREDHSRGFRQVGLERVNKWPKSMLPRWWWWWWWSIDDVTENSCHITMYTPETLLTKYLRISRQKFRATRKQVLSGFKRNNIGFNFYLNKIRYCCFFLPKAETLCFLLVQ